MYAAWERKQKNNVTFSSGWTFAGHFCADELADPTDVHCLPREGVESRRGLSRGSPTLSSCSAGAVRRRRKTRGGVRTEAVPERGLPSYSVPLGSAPEAGRTPNWLRQRGTAGGDCAGHLGSLPSIFWGEEESRGGDGRHRSSQHARRRARPWGRSHGWHEWQPATCSPAKSRSYAATPMQAKALVVCARRRVCIAPTWCFDFRMRTVQYRTKYLHYRCTT